MKNYQQKTSEAVKKDLKISAPSVSEYMTRNLITFKPETEIKEVISTLLKKRITGAPVLNDNDEVVGLIDDKDCLNVLVASAYYNQPSADTVANYMTTEMKSVSIHDNIVEIADTFVHSKFKRLLVMDDNGKLVGQISRRDVLRAIQELNANTW